MRIKLELTETELKNLVANEIFEKFPNAGIMASDIKIEVKSKQNYKSEWETASFRAIVDKN